MTEQPGAARRRLSIQRLSSQASVTRRGIQIGPKIRVGGTVGKIGQAAKIGLGKLDKAVAPYVAMIPGVGQIAAPVMNMAGTVMDTSHGGVGWGDLAKAGAQSAGMYGAGKLLSHVPGVSALQGKLGKLAPALSMAASHAIPGAPGAAPGGAPGGDGGGGIGGALAGIGEWLGGNGGKNALGVAQGLNAAMLQKQSTDYAKRAMGSVQGSYDERAPLRKQGMANMLQPKIPSLAGLSAIAGANPYAPRPTATGAQPLVPVGGGGY